MQESLYKPFLKAEWRYLILLNFEIPPSLLKNFVPQGCELDFWEGKTYVSLVGFLFLNTKIFGLPIPFHRNFEEVNLRLYVKRKVNHEWRRGVVFIKEIVPRWAIAKTAKVFYNENYVCFPMSHEVEKLEQSNQSSLKVSYQWDVFDEENFIQAEANGLPDNLQPHSQEEFIAEHYWGYTAQKDSSTLEYRVEHSPWRIWRNLKTSMKVNVAKVYGDRFVPYLSQEPDSAFLLEGSPITVSRGRKISDG